MSLNIADIVNTSRKHTKGKETYLFVNDLEDAKAGNVLAKLKTKIIRERVAINGNSQMRRLVRQRDFENAVSFEDTATVSPKSAASTTKSKPAAKATSAQTYPGESTVSVNVGKGFKAPEIKIGIPDSGFQLATIKKTSTSLVVTKVPRTLEDVRKLVQPIASVEYKIKSQQIQDLCNAYSRDIITRDKLSEKDLKDTKRIAYREPRRMLYSEFERVFAAEPRIAMFTKARSEDAYYAEDSYIRQVYNLGMLGDLMNVALVLFQDYLD